MWKPYQNLKNIWGLAFLSLTLSTSFSQPSHAQNRSQVLVTHSVLCDLTQQIAQDTIDMTCLIEAGEDPHAYQAKPRDRQSIETAKLIFYGGYDFEPAIVRLIEATQNSAPKIAVSEEAVPNPILGEHHHHGEEHEHEEHEHEEHEHEEEEMAADPHVWHNVNNAIAMVEVVRKHLSELSPANAQMYGQNAAALTEELKQLDTWIKSQISTIPENKRVVVTSHEALQYYGDAYGLEIEGVLESLTTESQPSAARLRELVEEIKATGISTIFVDTSTNPRLVETLAREASVMVSQDNLYTETLGISGSNGETYQGMMKSNTCAIVNGLGGSCTSFASQQN
jgi:manganese/iron transport system substrate-binding protein